MEKTLKEMTVSELCEASRRLRNEMSMNYLDMLDLLTEIKRVEEKITDFHRENQ